MQISKIGLVFLLLTMVACSNEPDTNTYTVYVSKDRIDVGVDNPSFEIIITI